MPMMNLLKGIAHVIPFRTICLLFMIWNNSSYAIQGNEKNVGFYCDDESIKKSYHGDSINIYMLFFVLLGVFGFIVNQCVPVLEEEKKKKSNCFSNYHLRDYYTGFLFVITITEVFKFIFTELRPHFFYTCMPDMTKIDCSKGLVTSFNCTGTGPRWLVDRDIYKSFPSGHSSTSVYAFVFITLLLCKRRKSSKSVWCHRFVPVLFFIWAVMCCMSRILDNRHFWWDVLFGVSIGIIGGYIMARYSLRRAHSHCKTT
ncbi:putative phosphatidate phosphatase [Parasteatoda tepidariorum]|uniref:putative phosphatidate phosphatase n=1 Tax=Parasteatoda tepidariorum TaxID=114398 RepID=UPI001C7184CC|nr:putative phosphatidate phosphatase [Parasteatoda tepidariorum]